MHPNFLQRFSGLHSLLVLSAATLLGAGCDPLPPSEPAGPWAIGHSSFSVTDSSRGGRTLPVDAWYPIAVQDATGAHASYGLPSQITTGLGLDRPATLSGNAIEGAPAAAQSFPLIVISHGDGGSSLDYYYLTEELATHGFVVVAPNHVGDTVLDAFAGTTVSQAQTLSDRPLDVSFLISYMLAANDNPGDPFNGRIAKEQIGVGGHSYGGYTTIAEGTGAGSFLPDTRVRALLPIDPYSTPFSAQQLGSLQVPIFYFSGTRSDLHSAVVASFEETIAPQAYLADIKNAAHQNFSWLCPLAQALTADGLPPAQLPTVLGPAYAQSCQAPAISYADAFRLTNLYASAFFLSVLKNESYYNQYLDPTYTLLEQPLASLQASGTTQ